MMIAKLIHNLVNTNKQNNKYYGTSPLCPSCNIEIETMAHVLTCQSPGAAANRAQALSILQADLAAINTPSQVIDAINHGTLEWERTQRQPHTSVHAKTRGSLQGPDMLLTMAFTDQFQNIGWLHLLMGRLSRKWGAAVSLYGNKPNDSNFQTMWTAQAITSLWKYTRSIWGYRNTVVHGATDQEKADKIIEQTATKVREFYSKFTTTPTFILQRHHYLFTSRTLSQRLKLDIDSMNCWIRSVEDAVQALRHHEQQQRAHSSRYFAPFFVAGHLQPADTETENDSTYLTPSTNQDEDTITTFTQSTVITTTTNSYTTSTSSIDNSTAQSINDSEQSSCSNDPPSIISWSTS